MALPDARVVVLVRQGCHLCDDAVVVVDSVCRERGVPWRAVDVDSDPELRARYTDHVPVTFVDGRQHALWFVQAGLLAEALA
ncbi:MAG: glutaredoxin family protein [Actinomycetes bacterium]